MIITTELDLNQELMCKFTFGDEHGHNNKITYQLYGDITDQNLNILNLNGSEWSMTIVSKHLYKY